MPREHEWDSRWWSPVINAEHLRMREAAGVIDLTAFQIFDIEGAGRARQRAADLRRAVRRRGRQGHLHPGARRPRRLPLRPDRDAARRRPLPGRHRRRPRPGRPPVVRRPPRGRRHDHRQDQRALDDRPVGSEGTRHPRLADRRRRLRRGLPDAAAAGRSSVDGATVLASRISYVGELGWELYVSMDDAAGLWEALLDTGQSHGTGAGGHRRLRHHRPHREGLPRLRLRARRRAHHRRGRHAAAQGQGSRLRRQGGLRRAARGGRRRRCCAR